MRHQSKPFVLQKSSNRKDLIRSSDESDWEPQDLINDSEVKPNSHLYHAALLKGLIGLSDRSTKGDTRTPNNLETTRNRNHVELVTKSKKKV